MLLQMARFSSFLWLRSILLHLVFFIHSSVGSYKFYEHWSACIFWISIFFIFCFFRCIPRNGIARSYDSVWTSPVAQTVKHLPTVWETWVRSLGQEDSLEKEMAIHSSILAWKIPWTDEHSRLQSMGSQRVRHDWVTSLHFIQAEKNDNHILNLKFS